MTTVGQAVVEIRGDDAKLRRALAESERETRAFTSRASSAIAGMGRAFALAGAALAAAGIGAIAGEVLRTTAQFEKLQASLKTVTGSAEQGRAAFAMISDFAKSTPFDVQQATEAFIRLQSLGLDPSREALVSYGNTASAMGKSLIQYVEAIADATTGEFERLKEFGIKASQQGNSVKLTFQGVTTTVGKNAKEIEAYLRGLGNTKFAGAMDEQAKTLGGALSNLGDSWSQFQNSVGKGGFSAAIADVAREMSGLLDKNQSFASSLGSGLGAFVTQTSNGVTVLANAIHVAESYVVAFGQAYSSAFASVGASTGTAVTQIEQFGSVILAGAGSSANGVLSAYTAAINGVVGAFVAGYRAVTIAWQQLPAVFSDLGARAANALISALNSAIAGAVAPLNAIIGQINKLGGNIAPITAPSFAPIENAAAGAAEKIKADLGAAVGDAFDTDYLGKATAAVQAEISKVGALAEAYRQTAAQKRAAASAANDNAPAFTPSKSAGGGSFGSAGGGAGGGSSRARRTADDRFAQDLQAIRDRTAALRDEAATVGMTYEVQESRRIALQLEQAALADLREEARRKGETDLASIQLSEQQIAQIRSVADAYGSQSNALRMVEEAQRRVERAAGESYDAIKSGVIGAITGANSLKDALSNVLQKLADIAMSSAFDNLFKPAGGGGFFDILSKGIGTLFGGSSASAPAMASAGTFSVQAPKVSTTIRQPLISMAGLSSRAANAPIPIDLRVSPTPEFDVRMNDIADTKSQKAVVSFAKSRAFSDATDKANKKNRMGRRYG